MVSLQSHEYVMLKILYLKIGIPLHFYAKLNFPF